MIYYIYTKIKEFIYDDYYIDPEIKKINSNLKKTTTLKKTFYKPTLNELNNKIFFIKLKNKIKLNPIDLINEKINLKKVSF